MLPATWRYVERFLIGARVPHTADGNVRVGVAFLHSLLHQFGGDERLALAWWTVALSRSATAPFYADLV